MRVAIVTNNYASRVSGVAVAVDFLNDSLSSIGIDTMIAAPDYGIKSEVKKGAHVERVPSFAVPQLKMALTLERFDRTKVRYLMRGSRPDIIHCHHPFLLGQAAVALA